MQALFVNSAIVAATDPEKVIYIVTRLCLYMGVCRKTVGLLFDVSSKELIIDTKGQGHGAEDIFKFMKTEGYLCRPDMKIGAELIEEAQKKTKTSLLLMSMIYNEGISYFCFLLCFLDELCSDLRVWPTQITLIFHEFEYVFSAVT